MEALNHNPEDFAEQLDYLFDNSDQLSQACVMLFESEFEKGRAYISGSQSINFDSESMFAKYYKLSEHLRYTNQVCYESMKSFLVRHYKDKKVPKKRIV